MTIDPRRLLASITDVVVRGPLPPGMTPAVVHDFVRRHEGMLERVIAQELAATAVVDVATPRTAAKRTAANVAALQALLEVEAGGALSPERLTTLRRYTGWGGLSISKAKVKLPAGAPVPDSAALIHEYYTPARVTDDVGRVLAGLWGSLPRFGGKVRALEPSAGIGRFVWSVEAAAPEPIDWHLVELSQASGRLLRAMRPADDVTLAPFERWVTDHRELHGQLSLVVANPPYGPRGASLTEDPDRSYRDKRAYAYFLRRGLDLLAKDGVGVFVVPAGFVSGTGRQARELREAVLRRHHLLGAFRLPSGLFPGAQLVTDLLFFRARGGELEAVLEEDAAVLDGRYFEQFPQHVLGEEVGKVDEGADVTAKPRWGYQVRGDYPGLPDFTPRPLCVGCGTLRPFHSTTKRSSAVSASPPKSDGLAHAVARAVALGARVGDYLAATSHQDARTVALHGELVTALRDWVAAHGNPRTHVDLLTARRRHPEVDRFLTAFDARGSLIPGLATAPVHEPPLGHLRGDVVGLAEYLRSVRRPVTVDELAAVWTGVRRDDLASLTRARTALQAALPQLAAAGWRHALPGAWLHPDDVTVGELWPRVDAIEDALQGRRPAWTDRATLTALRDELLAAIGPLRLEQLGRIEPRAQWLPLSLVAAWMRDEFGVTTTLERRDGLLVPTGADYVAASGRGEVGPIHGSAAWFLGWCNHDRTVFRPPQPGKHTGLTLDDARLQLAEEWTASFESWVRADRERVREVETTYNRMMRGRIDPTYSDAPLELGRWATGPGAIVPHPHQRAGARRIVANNGGLLAYDVGVGKTYTALLILARMRELGRKRPVILVPNSIVWKWADDIARVLPDYEVLVVGSHRKTVKSGARQGERTSRTDTPEERAAKWARFQAGEADVVLCTYSVFERTQISAEWVERYVDKAHRIKRMISLERRNAKGTKSPSERQEALDREGARAWVAERLELPAGQRFDPGIAWDELGVDLLIVDEAQNFKNLYLPEQREGGVPRFMGNAGSGAKRAWQLDFRAATVRERSDGGGVVLLSATPAKNSPLEFYSMLQYVDATCWEDLGIYDAEGFIDRFIDITMEQTLDSRMRMVKKSACTGFKRLDELRGILFRYGEFLTAEDVGLKLPEASVEFIELDMSAAQEERYTALIDAMEEALGDPDKAGDVLGLLARMSLVCIHPELDQGYKWKSAQQADVDPHSPKFDAIAKRIATKPRCGHIVFLDNTAGHAWLREVLVAHGIPRDRIAVLSAETAKAPADRMRIAHAFNGSDDTPPQYDVVIANQVAYEGIDLQKRTCSIHHADLPWEPATLQQRNGRGVRQGNQLATIGIYYYFAKRSLDGLRFNLISGKLGWMKQLIKSTDRETTNPGASLNLGKKDILLLISRDPEATRKQLEEMERAARVEELRKLAEGAGRLLRTANARFRAAERALVDSDAAEERAEGERLLAELAHVEPEAWPYIDLAQTVRERPLRVTAGGLPLWEGQVLRGPADEDLVAIVGRIDGRQVGLKRLGATSWTEGKDDAIERLIADGGSVGSMLTAAELEQERLAVQQPLGSYSYHPWDTTQVSLASDVWAVVLWNAQRDRILQALRYRHGRYLPVVRDGRLVAVPASTYGLDADNVLPPTRAGWERFVALVRQLDTAAQRRAARQLGTTWWARTLPHNRRDRVEEAA